MIRCEKCSVPYRGSDPERFLAMHSAVKGICRPQHRLRECRERADYWNQELRAAEDALWNSVTKPCSGSGYAHKPHGACPGYSTDRT